VRRVIRDLRDSSICGGLSTVDSDAGRNHAPVATALIFDSEEDCSSIPVHPTDSQAASVVRVVAATSASCSEFDPKLYLVELDARQGIPTHGARWPARNPRPGHNAERRCAYSNNGPVSAAGALRLISSTHRHGVEGMIVARSVAEIASGDQPCSLVRRGIAQNRERSVNHVLGMSAFRVTTLPTSVDGMCSIVTGSLDCGQPVADAFRSVTTNPECTSGLALQPATHT